MSKDDKELARLLEEVACTPGWRVFTRGILRVVVPPKGPMVHIHSGHCRERRAMKNTLALLRRVGWRTNG